MIILEFDEKFKLPFSPNCSSDRIEIYDGQHISNKLTNLLCIKHLSLII